MRTYENYFPFENEKKPFDPEELLKLVGQEQLEAKYGIYLESNNENTLTLGNMPWLDIGDLPVSYNTKKKEAYQVFLTP